MLTGSIFEEITVLSTDELGRLCRVDTRRIVALVDEGVLEVSTDANGDWRFDASALRRARLALRLENDLGLNLPGVGLAVELLDEIAALRRQLSMIR